MTADPTTTLAAHGTYEHVTADLFRCECGLEFLWQAFFPDTIFAAHQLAVLAEEGWAIVKLPEADGDDGNNVSWPFASMWHKHRTITTYPRRNHDYTPTEARAMAADLLAAARAAEGVDQ